MPTQTSKRVQLAEAALDCDALSKRERQALASTYEEAVRRNAKSVQVCLTTSRKGRRVMKTSVYLQWPHGMQVDAEEQEHYDARGEQRAPMPNAAMQTRVQQQVNAAAAGDGAAAVAPCAAPVPADNTAARFTVHAPSKEARQVKRAPAAPAPRAVQPARQKVDKNALSARGLPAGGEQQWTVVTGRKKSGRSSPASPTDNASPRKSPRGSSAASDTDVSEMEEEQASCPPEPGHARARLAARAERLVVEGWTAADIVRGSRVGPDGQVMRITYDPTIAEKPSEQRQIMHDALVSRA